MNIKASIIVPVYNVEKYLRRCLDNIVNQTLREIEIILVDDGSTDNSGDICDEYARQDKRITVIHKQNGGLGSARKIGFENVSGEYFFTFDSDDWPEPTMCEKLYVKAKSDNLDVVLCDYIANYTDGHEVQHTLNVSSRLSDQNKIIHGVVGGTFPSMVWNRMIKTSVLRDNDIAWEDGINLGEDHLISMKLYQINLKIGYINEPLYHYLRRPGEDSYTNRITIASYKQMEYIRHWIESNFDKEEYSSEIFYQWVNLAFSGLRVPEMKAQYYHQSATSHILVRDIFKHKITDKVKIVLLAKMLGLHMAQIIFNYMYKRVYR